MNDGLTILAAMVTAIFLIVGVLRVSMWLTSRKKASDFKKERPDATESNSGGYSF